VRARVLKCARICIGIFETYLPPTKEDVYVFARVRLSVCLSVCLLARLLKNACMDLDEMLRVDRSQMSGHGRTDLLLSPIRIIVRMPEPDCFLRYRMRCNAEFYYVGKIPPIYIGLQRRVVLKWFYSPRAVGTILSEVHALYQVPFYRVRHKKQPPKKN